MSSQRRMIKRKGKNREFIKTFNKIKKELKENDTFKKPFIPLNINEKNKGGDNNGGGKEKQYISKNSKDNGRYKIFTKR
ncbi:MAG: hypothetical protein KAX49_07375 [Halanaerobiales bacterium]|nr:hypothetical protein [Halanaerobiales bacterium]